MRSPGEGWGNGSPKESGVRHHLYGTEDHPGFEKLVKDLLLSAFTMQGRRRFWPVIFTDENGLSTEDDTLAQVDSNWFPPHALPVRPR